MMSSLALFQKPVGHRRKLVWPLLCVAPLWVGCQSENGDSPPTAADAQADTRPSLTRVPTVRRDDSAAARAEAPVVVSQPERDLGLSSDDMQRDVVAPEVLLSFEHQETCRVKVGDTFPDVSALTLDGQLTTLDSQLGERLTIVVFWSGHQPMSVEQIRRLQGEFAERYRDAGVSVVTINVGDSPEEVHGILGDADTGFANLCDPEREAFSRIATSMLPRTYLLRADRQVVWFDMEYSRSTRRELRNAILFVLKQFAQQANTSDRSLM